MKKGGKKKHPPAWMKKRVKKENEQIGKWRHLGTPGYAR